MIDHVELSTPQLVDQLEKASEASTVRSLAAELSGRIKLAQEGAGSPMWALAQAHKEIRLIDMISDDIGEEALLGNKLVAAALRNHAEHYITAVLGRAWGCLLEALVDAAAPLALGSHRPNGPHPHAGALCHWEPPPGKRPGGNCPKGSFRPSG